MDFTISLKFILVKSNCWYFSSSNSSLYCSNNILSLRPCQYSQLGNTLSFSLSIRKVIVNSEAIQLYFHSLVWGSDQLWLI